VNPQPPGMALKRHHWAALIALVLLTLAILIWSTRGVGTPNPADRSRPVGDIAEKAQAARAAAITRFSLICLDFLAKARPTEAVKYCSLALELDPKSIVLLNLRGNARMLAGQGNKAIEDFTTAIALAPGDASAYRFRANVYVTLHRDAKALADYNRAIALDPRNAIGLELRGQYYQTHGAYGTAIADFSGAIARDPMMARAWNSRCWTRVLANTNPAAALADCDHAIALDPDSANAYDSRGYVRVRMAKYREAIADFDSALGIEPRLASSLFGRGLSKQRIGDKTAMGDINRARQIEPGIETRIRGYGFRLKANGPSGA
jgi:tetratricopeptide (TPR) repeat protein